MECSLYINSDAKNAGTGEDVDEFVYHAVLYLLTLSYVHIYALPVPLPVTILLERAVKRANGLYKVGDIDVIGGTAYNPSHIAAVIIVLAWPVAVTVVCSGCSSTVHATQTQRTVDMPADDGMLRSTPDILHVYVVHHSLTALMNTFCQADSSD